MTTTPVRPLPSPAPWRGIVRSLLLVLCGTIIGSGLALGALYHFTEVAIHHPERNAHQLAQRLDRQLGLTDDQAARVESVLNRDLMQMRANRHADLRQIAADVAAVLTPQQAAKWRAQCERAAQRWGIPPDAAPSAPSPLPPRS